MSYVNAIEGRELCDDARRQAWQETGWLVLTAGVTALALVAAGRGLDGVPSAWVWLLAGFGVSELCSAVMRAGRAWWEAQAVTRCATCRGAEWEIGEAWGVQDRCARHGHRGPEWVA